MVSDDVGELRYTVYSKDLDVVEMNDLPVLADVITTIVCIPELSELPELEVQIVGGIGLKGYKEAILVGDDGVVYWPEGDSCQGITKPREYRAASKNSSSSKRTGKKGSRSYKSSGGTRKAPNRGRR